MTTMRQLLFNLRISQQDILREANKRAKKKVYQARVSKIMNGKCEATEFEKNKIRLALSCLGVSDEKILKIRELVSSTRTA